MARVESDVNGNVVRFVALGDLDPGTHPQATQSLAFDDDQNAPLVADLRAQTALYTLLAGALKKSGVTQPVAADGPRAILRASSFAGAVGVKADRLTTSGSFVDIPDLAFALEAGSTYAFYFDGAYTAAAGTTGLQLALSGPASPAFFGASFEIYESATGVRAAVSGAYDVGVNGVNSGGATPLPFHVSGVIKTGASAGTLALRGRSEVAGNQVTVKQGSYGMLFKAG